VLTEKQKNAALMSFGDEDIVEEYAAPWPGNRVPYEISDEYNKEE
jgi:hypothetical protein